MLKPKKKRETQETQERPYRYFEVTGDYAIGHGKDEVVIAHMTPKERAAMRYRLQATSRTDLSLTAVGFLDLIGADAAAYMGHALSPGAFITAQILGISVGAYPVVKMEAVRKRSRKIRNRFEAGIPDRTGVLRFSKREVKYDLPTAILEKEVEFLSESGLVSKPAGKLLEATKGFTGIESKVDTEKQRISGSICLRDVVRTAFNSSNETNREDLLYASLEPLTTMFEASKSLPEWARSNMQNMPDGIRHADERMSSELLLSSLGVFAVARSHFGQQIAESIKDLFAERGDDPLIADAQRLGNPTTEDVSWKELQYANMYMSGLKYNY